VKTAEEWNKLAEEADQMEDEDQAAAAMDSLALHAPPEIAANYGAE